jgi:hypothetical protein
VGLRHELGPLFEVNVAGKAKPFWIAPNLHYRISDGGCSRFEPGLGIAFRAKPVVKEGAGHAISTLGLDAVLYLLKKALA